MSQRSHHWASLTCTYFDADPTAARRRADASTCGSTFPGVEVYAAQEANDVQIVVDLRTTETHPDETGRERIEAAAETTQALLIAAGLRVDRTDYYTDND